MDKTLKIVGVGLGILLLLVMVLFYLFYNPSEYSIFPKCPFYSITGLYCPGCGSQRAVHQILNGHIISGLSHNVLIILLVLVLTYDAMVIAINKMLKRHYKNILYKATTTYAVLIIVILFWIFRNIDLYPFSILAP